MTPGEPLARHETNGSNMDKRITFLGGAQNVTGSRHLVQAGKSTLLIDCGLHQERQFRDRDDRYR